MPSLGALEIKLEQEGLNMEEYEKTVGLLIDIEADNRSLEEIVSIRGNKITKEELLDDLKLCIEVGLYREVYRRLMSFDGLFAFKVRRNKGKNLNKLIGEKLVRGIR